MKPGVLIRMRIPLVIALLVFAMMTAPAQQQTRFVGSITAITGRTLTVKPDAGEARTFDVAQDAEIKRIAPGEKSLTQATVIAFSDLAVGDRVLVRLNPVPDTPTPLATQIIAIKAQDLLEQQQKERQEWQRNGVAGLVKTLNPADNVITLTTGAGASTRTVTIHITKSTVLKRYPPGSVRYEQAKPAPMDAIHPGDQLRARGQKSPDGSEITAVEVVSGSFRNIAGTVASLDPARHLMAVKDLATKKLVSVTITPETQMRRLPEQMAQMLAVRLKGGTPGVAGPGGPPHASAPGTPGAGGPPPGAPGNGHRAWNGPGGGTGLGGPNGGSADPQQMLSRAPVIHFNDLQKGEAVMLVTTEGATDVDAITLLAGVEPLLEAPEASQNLLSNWSMGGGGVEGAAGTP
jgi:hypothetical protein